MRYFEGLGSVCPTCGMVPTKAGHDPCIAELPDVTFACCGHGVLRANCYTTCYVLMREPKVLLYGRAAQAAMEMLGGSPPPIPLGEWKHPARRVMAA